MMPVAGGVEEALLILLVAGHLVGDFALQSEGMAPGNRSGPSLVAHAALIALAHLILLAPLLSWALAAVAVGLAISYPYTDEELRRIHTPLLAQIHGRLQFAYQGAMIDRLRAMGKPVDILYFETAPHSTKQPRHRLRSLTTHIDWWRFWLQGYEDPEPAKATQCTRWRELGLPDH